MNILITGARSGIGYATALELLKKGHYVYLSVHTESQLREVEKLEELQGRNVQCLKLDITDDNDIDRVKDLDIDILINNAAIGNSGSIIEATMDFIRDNYEVNVFGTIKLTQVFLQKMVMRNKGRIIMISSMLGEMPFPWFGIYSSTKAAITNISTALSKELKQVGSKVKVVIIEPGFYHTGFNQLMMDKKFENEESFFGDLQEKIRDNERYKVNVLEKDDVKSIADAIVKAVEEEKPKLKYKAPLIQAIIEKASIIKNK